ncbi:MAG: biopolymer transporter ExbD [Syntrophobacterales bacterium]|nr:biopolymer transporter ExbD [Syntrophobacterales bacterium]
MEEKEFDYFNVIPLVDVMLVLLTIVLTTSTFIATGMISVSLPKSPHGQDEIIKRSVITIDRNGTVYFNSNRIGLKELGKIIGELDKDAPVLVRADREIRLQVFVDVLGVLNSRGLKRVAIQTEKGG